ncbi:hypothetical protein ZWY2020_035693 [Hordeum vulgare]|nr:hypothetical protein ZWY2020_035693 [Hordeum vulgare]
MFSRQASSPQVATSEPATPSCVASLSVSDPSGSPSECENRSPAAEVFMAGSHESPSRTNGTSEKPERLQRFGEDQPSEKDQEKEDKEQEDPFPKVHDTLMIFADVESKSRLKVVNREVNMTYPSDLKYLKWSQTTITFGLSDHPTHVPTLGRQALVVDLVVEGVRLCKVLMDGGSGLNIMYADTLKGMGIPMSKLNDSNMQFHRVIPGKKAKSLGQIALDVVFGSDKNFRKEKLTFEVVDFQSAYHAILGRPANLDMSPVLDDAYDATARDTMPGTALPDSMPDTAYDAMPDTMLDTARDVMPDDARDAMLDTTRDTTLHDVPLGVEQVLKAKNDFLNELNDNSVRVITRGGKMTQEPLYPEGHPKRIDQDSQGINADTPSRPKEKKKDDRNLHASSQNTVTREEPNDISASDAETQSGDEHEPGDNMDSDVHNNAQPSNDEDVEIEPTLNPDNPQPKRYNKNEFTAMKHGKES